MAYFGFFRKGCVCPIGATQNIALALFQPAYVIPAATVLFFTLPLVSTLFFGRTFCSSVCPLGAIQELVIYKPLKVPEWIARPLSFVPVLYLGFAVLFAATGSEFIICRFDPFVSIFRLGGGFGILMLGAVFIITGIFVARPYCRFFCPYGVILSWVSRLSRRHVSITPDSCIHCTLCENACPVDAIRGPSPTARDVTRDRDRRRVRIVLLVSPLIIFTAAVCGRMAHTALARMHPTIRTAERVVLEDAGLVEGMTLDSEAFRASQTSKGELLSVAEAIAARFKTGSTLLGLYVGVMFCLHLISLFRREINPDYRPDRGECVSCGRCFTYCPREHAARRKSEAAV